MTASGWLAVLWHAWNLSGQRSTRAQQTRSASSPPSSSPTQGATCLFKEKMTLASVSTVLLFKSIQIKANIIKLKMGQKNMTHDQKTEKKSVAADPGGPDVEMAR